MTDPETVRAVVRAFPVAGGLTVAEAVRRTGRPVYDVRGAFITLRLAGRITRQPAPHPHAGARGWLWSLA